MAAETAAEAEAAGEAWESLLVHSGGALGRPQTTELASLQELRL